MEKIIIQTKTTWRKMKLGEIVNVYGGGTPSTSNPSYWSGDIAWLTPAEVVALNGSRFIDKTERYITEEGFKNSSARVMPINSLLLTSRATIGEITINKVPMATNQGFINIEPKNNDLMFLFYWLKKNKKCFNQMAIGSTFNELSKSVFKKIEILIPEDVSEQKKIADILSAFDDKIELNNKINKNLEQMAQAIFKEWFVKNKKSKSKNQKLEEVAKIIKGKKPQRIYNKPRGGDLEYLLIESFTTNNQFFTDDKKMPQSEEGDTIVVMDGASSGRIFRGRKGTVGSTLAVVKPGGEISQEFLSLLLKRTEPQLMDNLTGSAIPHLDKDFLRTYPVSVFPREIMNDFTTAIKPVLQKMVEVEKENQKLVALRDLLLPKLMNGEIGV